MVSLVRRNGGGLLSSRRVGSSASKGDMFCVISDRDASAGNPKSAQLVLAVDKERSENRGVQNGLAG